MLYCLNPHCQSPENSHGTNFCKSCGTGLVSLLRERYQIISILGSGGFGRTFLAEDTGMPSTRRCVLKQLKPVAHNPQIEQLVQERFQREASILEELGEENPYIPTLYDYFTNGNQFYLVQQWVDGETLTEKVQRLGSLSESDSRDILISVLEILDYVHSKNIIHRDIKPDNIIIRYKDGKPILIDFGAVKETMSTIVNAQGTPISSIVIGTPGYMASEQAAGKPVRSSDLYSLGLTIIYAMTAKIPQELPLNQNTGEIIWHQYASNISYGFVAVLDKSIRWHPRDRYPNAKDMLSALQSPQIPPQPPNPNPPPQTQRTPVTRPIRPTRQVKRQQQPRRQTYTIPWGWLVGTLLGYAAWGWVGAVAAASFVAGGVVGAVAVTMAGAGGVAGAEAWARASPATWPAAWAGAWAWAMIMAVAGIVAMAMAVAGIVAMAMAGAGIGTVIMAWAGTWAVLKAVGNASDELRESFSSFHIFLILTATSWLGLGLGYGLHQLIYTIVPLIIK